MYLYTSCFEVVTNSLENLNILEVMQNSMMLTKKSCTRVFLWCSKLVLPDM